ncbi:hypothetical protein [Nocardia niigatensis]
MSGPAWQNWYQCSPCGKRLHKTRKIARQAARVLRNERMSVYECPHLPGWHVGHLPTSVRAGTESRGDHYAHAA